LATVQLCPDVSQDNFALITVPRARQSMHVEKYLDDRPERNKAAFAKIRTIRGTRAE